MKTFKDTAGREWVLNVTAWEIKRVFQATKVDLSRLADNALKGLTDLLSDPAKLVDVLWVMILDQAKKAGVSEEQFGMAFAGDTLSEAGDAFVGAVLDFFPSGPREAAQEIISKGRLVGELMRKQALADLRALDPEKVVGEMIARAKAARAAQEATASPLLPTPAPPSMPPSANTTPPPAPPNDTASGSAGS